MVQKPNDATKQAAQLGEIGFPEFTSKLISDTFSAIVSSMIDQQKAYADLVEKVAMSIEDFETEAVTNQDVDRWLANNFPGGRREKTLIQAGNTLESGDTNALHRKLGETAGELSSATLPAEGESVELKEGEHVSDIRSVVRRKLARPRMDALQQLVEQGVVRLVVDDGTIETDLEFHTESHRTASTSSSEYDRDSWGVQADAGFVGSMFGISASGGASSLNVTTKNSRNTARSSTEIDVGGRVKINVRGDYQPLRVPEQDEDESQSDDSGGN